VILESAPSAHSRIVIAGNVPNSIRSLARDEEFLTLFAGALVHAATSFAIR
jgi:hypothetical protein